MVRSVLTQFDLNNIPVKNLAIEPVSSLPPTVTAGRLVILASNSKLYYGAGETWFELGLADSLPELTMENIEGLVLALSQKAAGSDLLVLSEQLTALAAVVAEKAAKSHSHTIADVADLSSQLQALSQAIAGKAAQSHNHTAANISDFTSAVNELIVSYFQTVGGVDEQLDTLREIIDFIKANAASLELMIRRYDADVGSGTSVAIEHGLNSLDCQVEVYEKASGATVICDVTRTNLNVVTLGFAVAPAANSLRVVIKV